MSEKEGEIKKRVLLIIGKGSLEPLLSPLAVRNRIGDVLGEVFEILDEAKKEFPLTTPKREKDPEFWSELASDRLQWFKKWFR